MNDGRTTVVQSPFTIKDKESKSNWSECYRRYRLVLKSETGEQIPLFDLEYQLMGSLYNNLAKAGFRGIGTIGNKKYVFQILNVTEPKEKNYKDICDYCYSRFRGAGRAAPVSLVAREILYVLATFACHSAVDGKLRADNDGYATYTPYADYSEYGISYNKSGNYYTSHHHEYVPIYEKIDDDMPMGFSFADQIYGSGFRFGKPWKYCFGDSVEKLVFCRDAKALQRGLRNIQSDFLTAYIDNEFPMKKLDAKVLLKVDFLDGSDYLLGVNDYPLWYYSSGHLAYELLCNREIIDGLTAVKGDKTLYVRTTGSVKFETIKFNLKGKQRMEFYDSERFQAMKRDWFQKYDKATVVKVGVVKTP